MRVLVVTNMYPSQEEPQFGTFVKEQTEDLIKLGVEVEVLHFDGRKSWTRYVAAAAAIRRKVGGGRFDLVHAHYGLAGAAALLQRRVPVVTTFHGSDFSGAIPWQVWVSRFVARLGQPDLRLYDGCDADPCSGSRDPGRGRRCAVPADRAR